MSFWESLQKESISPDFQNFLKIKKCCLRFLMVFIVDFLSIIHYRASTENKAFKSWFIFLLKFVCRSLDDSRDDLHDDRLGGEKKGRI